jgi:outer membrane protein assembly factor BamA
LPVFKTVLLLIFLCPPLFAQSAKIEYRDGTDRWHRVVEKFLKRQTTGSVADTLQQFLTDNGFLDNNVRVDSDGTIRLTFGWPYKIGRIVLSKDANDTIEIDLDLNERNLNLIYDSLISGFQNQGFHYVSLTNDSMVRNDYSIDIFVSLNKGPSVKISSISYTGLTRTNRRLIDKYVGLTSGDTLKPSDITKSLTSLGRLDYLMVGDSVEITPDAGYQTASIRYNIIERKPFNINGGGGYIPDDGGRFLWFINLSGNNIFGQGIKSALLIDRKEKEKSLFILSYGQPLFLMGLGRGELAVQTRDFRDQFYEFSLSGLYELSINQGFSVLTRLGWKNVEPSDSSQRSYQVYSAGFGIAYGERDPIENCRNDLGIKWDLEYAGRSYRSKTDAASSRSYYNDTKTTLKAELSYNLRGQFNNHLEFDLRDIESSEKPLPLSELITFGGPVTLRGYRNDQFAAQRLALIREEARYFFGSTDYFYPFFDAAYFEWYGIDQNDRVKKEDDFRMGYGLGVKISSAANSIRFEFAWGKDNRLGEPRLNITLSNQF